MNAIPLCASSAIAQTLTFLHTQEAALIKAGADVRVVHHRGTGDILASIQLIWTPDGPARRKQTGEFFQSREYSFCIAVAHQMPITCYFDGLGIAAAGTRRSTMGPLDQALSLWFSTFLAESRALFQLHFGPSVMEISSDALANLVQRGEQQLRETVRLARAAAAGEPALV